MESLGDFTCPIARSRFLAKYGELTITGESVSGSEIAKLKAEEKEIDLRHSEYLAIRESLIEGERRSRQKVDEVGTANATNKKNS